MIATVHVSGGFWVARPTGRNGRYLFAGDAGNVINTQTRTTVARMGALVNSRYNIEIDFGRSSRVRGVPTRIAGLPEGRVAMWRPSGLNRRAAL